jgi:hypothetical protein
VVYALGSYSQSKRLLSQVHFGKVAESYEPLVVDKKKPAIIVVKDVELLH